MQGIREDIYEALMVTPVWEYPQSSPDSLGDTISLDPIEYRGYVYFGTEIVLNYEGKEELSNTQIYLRGDDADAIKTTSLISCLEIVRRRIITKKVYRGRQGVKVIGVIYLP